MFLISELIS